MELVSLIVGIMAGGVLGGVAVFALANWILYNDREDED